MKPREYSAMFIVLDEVMYVIFIQLAVFLLLKIEI